MLLMFFDFPWWAYILVTLVLTHITIVAVTIYLHRHQAHRALELHPVISHFLRFWLWLTTGMVTREWVAIHRKHHVRSDLPGDPHSPQVFGIRKVLFDGVDLYRQETRNTATIEKYGKGTPDDFIERKLYAQHFPFGLGLMLVIDIALFGPIGLSMWAVQMLWIPFFAAGVINGVGHYWGYRNFAPTDASRNIVPWGLLIGGEELHNNHHAYATSARFSNRWWEFDIGWLYICLLAQLHLARVKKVAPKVCNNPSKIFCDADTLRAVITHRCDVLARFGRSVRRTAMEEIRKRRTALPEFKYSQLRYVIKHWLQRDALTLPAKERVTLEQMLHSSAVLNTIDSMRQDLAALLNRSGITTEQLVKQLEDWCRRAETSGIGALREFSHTLRGYDLPSKT
ncbi:MAG: fatty acid desaturase [Formivibrio sp.]|nr:fatty acid desaturase [Formivibrio sp.]